MKSRIEIRTATFGIEWTAYVFNKGWHFAGSGITSYEGTAQFAASQAIEKFVPPTYGNK